MTDPMNMTDRCHCGHCYGTHADNGQCAWCHCLSFRPDPEATPKPYLREKAEGAEDGQYITDWTMKAETGS